MSQDYPGNTHLIENGTSSCEKRTPPPLLGVVTGLGGGGNSLSASFMTMLVFQIMNHNNINFNQHAPCIVIVSCSHTLIHETSIIQALNY